MSAIQSHSTNATHALRHHPPKHGADTSQTRGVTWAGVATMLYGLIAYASFLAAFLYAIGFVGNWLVPRSIDAGTPGPIVPSLLMNSALLVLFVAQHTIMARPAFKRWWTRFVPKPAERSTYVVAASACLGLLYWQWRPLP